MRSKPPVLFQVFGPIGCGRRTRRGLDHRVSVVGVIVVGGRWFFASGGGGGYSCGGSGYGGIAASRAGISATASAAVGVGAGGDNGGGGRGDGDGGAVGLGNITTTVVVVDVGYDNGVCGTIGSVAVGPPEHSQHNIRETRRCGDFSAAAEAAADGYPTGVNETSLKTV